MKFLVKRTLEQRGPIESEGCIEVEGTLLVSENPIISYYEDHRREGCDAVALYSAFYNGERAWLKDATWCANSPYCASGTEEIILDYKEGIDILVERDAIPFHNKD